MTIDDTLNTREATHGDYSMTASAAQEIKTTIRKYASTDIRLNYVMMESLDLIATKIARALVGDSQHADTWHDIAGYAQLVVRVLPVEGLNLEVRESAGLPEGAIIVLLDPEGSGYLGVSSDGTKHPGSTYTEAFQRALGGISYGPDNEPDPPSNTKVRTFRGD